MCRKRVRRGARQVAADAQRILLQSGERVDFAAREVDDRSGMLLIELITAGVDSDLEQRRRGTERQGQAGPLAAPEVDSAQAAALIARGLDDDVIPPGSEPVDSGYATRVGRRGPPRPGQHDLCAGDRRAVGLSHVDFE